jgi:hypothetical protein
MKKMLVLVMVCLMGTMALAGSIAVTNYSFEQPGAGKIQGWNGENGTDIPGWASSMAAADSGVESSWPGHTDGDYSGFLMSADPSAFNLTDHVIAAGEVFTLQVDARNNWSGGTPDFMLSLYYDVAGVRNTVASSTLTLTDGWATYALTFSANDVAGSIGNLIGIELDNVAAVGNSWEGMDNVRLDVVPEPATMLLLGLGGLLLRRKG